MGLRIKHCALGLLLALMAACATPSAGITTENAITKAKIDKLERGMTLDGVILILGQPESRLTTEDGEMLFFKDVNLDSVWVSMDKKGKLEDWIASN